MTKSSEKSCGSLKWNTKLCNNWNGSALNTANVSTLLCSTSIIILCTTQSNGQTPVLVKISDKSMTFLIADTCFCITIHNKRLLWVLAIKSYRLHFNFMLLSKKLGIVISFKIKHDILIFNLWKYQNWGWATYTCGIFTFTHTDLPYSDY